MEINLLLPFGTLCGLCSDKPVTLCG